MEWFKEYFIQNFVLLCVSIVLLVISIQRYKQHKKISLCIILVVASALILSIVELLVDYGEANAMFNLTMLMSIIGYSLRPVCLYFFILMSGKVFKGKLSFLSYLPLVLNAILFFLAFIPAVGEYVVTYNLNADGTLTFGGGPLRYFSHIVSLCYLAYLLYCSLAKLRARHLTHGLIILACAVFTVGSVIIESFFNDNGDIHLLNPTMVVGAMFYYLYLYIEKTQIDTLTGLFNRDSYYHDLPKMDRYITGVIQLDMNGLKYINDTYGHFEGDKALSTIAETILKSEKRKMYAYRMGGDEFTILANNSTEEEIKLVISKFKDLLKDTSYHCSIGYSYRKDKNMSVEDLMKEAETMMYHDKAEFYKNSPFERRKADRE